MLTVPYLTAQCTVDVEAVIGEIDADILPLWPGVIWNKDGSTSLLATITLKKI